MAISIDPRELDSYAEIEPNPSILPNSSERKGAMKGFLWGAVGTLALVGASYTFNGDSTPTPHTPETIEAPAPAIPIGL